MRSWRSGAPRPPTRTIRACGQGGARPRRRRRDARFRGRDGPRAARRGDDRRGRGDDRRGRSGHGQPASSSAPLATPGAAPEGGVLIDDATHRAAASAIAFDAGRRAAPAGPSEPVVGLAAAGVVAMRGGGGRSTASSRRSSAATRSSACSRISSTRVDDESRARLVSITGRPGSARAGSPGSREVRRRHRRATSTGTRAVRRPTARGRLLGPRRDGPQPGGDRRGRGRRGHPGQARPRWRSTSPTRPSAAIVPWLLALLGLQEAREGQTEEAVRRRRRLLRADRRAGLGVFVFEDLQWADDGLIDFIESVLEWSRNHRILIVTLSRPELLERRPTWGAGQRDFTALHLEPLADAAMTELLDGVAPGLPGAFVRRDRRTGRRASRCSPSRRSGCWSTTDGSSAMATLQGSPARSAARRAGVAPRPDRRRLDGLDPDDRALIQDAAVLGQTFTVDALAALDGPFGRRPRARLRIGPPRVLALSGSRLA